MTEDVIYLDDRRPHIRVTGGNGMEYVFPVRLAQDVAAGKTAPDALGRFVLQTIIGEWLSEVVLAEAAP